MLLNFLLKIAELDRRVKFLSDTRLKPHCTHRSWITQKDTTNRGSTLGHLLCNRPADMLAVVLVYLEHVKKDYQKLVNVHGPQRPAHPGIRLQDLRHL